MRTYDLTPFYRSTVGFDRFFNLLDQATADGSPGYPPYNIERTGENAYRISVAVSGFSQGELSIVAKENTLTIKGEKTANENGNDNSEGALPRHRGARLRARIPACRFRAGEERLARERSAPRRSRPRDPRGQEAPQHSDQLRRAGPTGGRRLGRRITQIQAFGRYWLIAKTPRETGAFLCVAFVVNSSTTSSA